MERTPSEHRVAVYARVSSERQAQEGTIASQVEALRQRVAQGGQVLDEARCYCDDGYIGGTLVRPALERLRDAVYAGELDRVYVLAPDRLARRHAYQVLLVDEFQRYGVELVFLNRPAVGSSPEENLLLQVQGMIAEYEQTKIVERCRRGKRSAARRGAVSVFAAAPYGYRYITKSEGGGEARYQVVLDQAQVVRQIFEWVGRERVSINDVSHRLTLQQVPTPKGGSRWSRQTVYGILKNPAYTGMAVFGRRRYGARRPRLRPPRGRPESPRRPVSLYNTDTTEQISVPVPALVSTDLFQTVQEQLTENRQRRRVASSGARHLLQGLLVCSCCGYAYYARRVTSTKGRTAPRSAYICPGTEPYRNGGQRICSNPALRGDQLDLAVWEDVRSLLHDPQRLLAEYQRRITGDPDGEPRVEEAQRIRQTQRQLDRLIDAYAAELVTKEEFESRARGLRNRLAELAAEQQATAAENNERVTLRQVIGDFQEFTRRMEQGLSNPTWETRRQILCTLVKRVEIEPEQVRVVYRVNPHPFAVAPNRGLKQDCLWRQKARAR